MARPTIKKGPASQHAGPDETIVEIFSKGARQGFLMSLREVTAQDGKTKVLVVNVYRADAGVILVAGDMTKTFTKNE